MKTRTIYANGHPIAIYENDVLVYSAAEFQQESKDLHHIMPDIKPYISMIDGREITSRSRHREHLRANGCIEIGDQTKYLKPKPVTTPPGLKETLIRVANEKLR
jgi:hypothetical protein